MDFRKLERPFREYHPAERLLLKIAAQFNPLPMNFRFFLLPILALFLMTSNNLQAQKTKQVRDGYTVKQLLLNKKGLEQLKAAPLLSTVAVLKGATLYPKQGYKIVALHNGKSAGIVPNFFKPSKETMAYFQEVSVKGILGACFCPAGEGGCRLKSFTGRDGQRDYNCKGACDCGPGILIFDIGIKIAKKENAEGTNDWPYNGSNFPHGF